MVGVIDGVTVFVGVIDGVIVNVGVVVGVGVSDGDNIVSEVLQPTLNIIIDVVLSGTEMLIPVERAS